MTAGDRAATFQRDGAIATLVLDRRSNSAILRDAIDELACDRNVRCVLMRGESFAAGSDMSSTPAAALQAIARCVQPTVALIEHDCTGAGLAMAAACDMRICGESSRFGAPATAAGVAIGADELQALLAVANRAVVLEILLEGRLLDAREAYRKRLVNKVVPDAGLEREGYALARRIAEGAPLVARWHKQFIERVTVRPALTP